jgi:adenylate cyclase
MAFRRGPGWLSGWRVHLRVGIVVVFLSVMLPLSAVMIAVLYRQNSQLAVGFAEDAMVRASNDTVISVQGLIDPIARTVYLSSTFGRDQRRLLRQPENWRALLEDLEQLPDLYSLYFGFASNGSFLQAVRLPPGIGKFGPHQARPPVGARFVIRFIDDAAGEMDDSYMYYARWGEVVGVERAREVRFDPRERPWYRGVGDADGVVISDAYVFSGIDRPGVTLSRRITTDDGTTLGVFAADLSNATLSHFLDQSRIGSHGIVFILDRDGRLIGYPDPAKAVSREHDRLEVVRADAVADPIVAGAVRRRDAGSGDHFQAALGAAGEQYLVSFTSVPGVLGKSWTVGVIADADEFVAPLRRASLVILEVGSVFLLFACFSVIRVSRLLTRPIAALIEEAAKIRRLELDAPIEVKSKITEIHALAQALATTKSALRSFGLYVPKELVREMVRKGNDTALGGRRRPLTILFTDLAEFTRTTEALSPEDVLTRLSRYFEVMSQAINDHHGTIDKFIGDSIMALWNAPGEDFDHAANACLATLACRAAAATLNRLIKQEAVPLFHTRFGVHSGVAVVGNVGSSQRMQYTALGAMVNLASRVEGLNKRFGTEILITGDVEAQVRGRFLLRPLGPVVAAGTSVPTALFELLGTAGETSAYPASARDAAQCRSWGGAYSAYLDRDWARAGDEFRVFLATYGDDAASRMLLAKCERFLGEPPPAEWDGALVFEEK